MRPGQGVGPGTMAWQAVDAVLFTKASFVLAGHATTPRHTSGLSVSPATAEDPVPGLHRPPVRRVKRARDDDLPPHQRIATT